jgi:tetratricopeptide (TPR) repeat protein
MKKHFYIVILFSLIISACDFTTDYVVREINGDTSIFFLKNNDIKNPIAREKFNEGLKYSQAGDHQRAYFEIKKADKIEPDNVIIINSLALNAFYLDRNSDNKQNYYALFERAIEIDKTFPYSYSNYAFCLNNNREFAKAVNLLNEGIKYVRDERTKPTFYYTLSISYIELNECELAKENINIAIELQKNRKQKREYRDFRRYILRTCK